jgi:hypothetical protein
MFKIYKNTFFTPAKKVKTELIFEHVGRLLQCCVSGSGIRCLFDPWIWDPGWVKIQDPDPG